MQNLAQCTRHLLVGSAFVRLALTEGRGAGIVRRLVRILLKEMQIEGRTVREMNLRILHFAGDGTKGSALLVQGSGKIRVAGEKDRVFLLADTVTRLVSLKVVRPVNAWCGFPYPHDPRSYFHQPQDRACFPVCCPITSEPHRFRGGLNHES